MTIPTVEISLAVGGAGAPAGNGIPALSRPAAPAPERMPAPPAVGEAAPAPASVAAAPAVTPDDAAVMTQPAAPPASGSFEPANAGPATTGDSGEAGGLPGGTGAGTDAGTGIGTGVGAGNGPALPAFTGLITPQPRSDIQPVYPRSARRAGWEGVVRISALVDALGMVVSADVSVSSGHDVLDQAALESVRRTFFTPARQNGTAIACRVIIPVRFQLK